MSGGGGGTSTTTSGIPDEYKGLARDYAARAQSLSNQAYTPYTGQRFADMTGAQTAAGNYYAQNLNGGTNPYLDQMVQKAQGNLISNYNNTIRPQLDVLDARSGSFGNTGVGAQRAQAGQTLGNQLSDISTQLYGGQYNADQANRMQSANSLLNYGNLQQQNQQNQLDFGYQQFQDAQNQPYKNLQTLGSPVQNGILGTVQKTTQSGGK